MEGCKRPFNIHGMFQNGVKSLGPKVFGKWVRQIKKSLVSIGP